jgi:hypothetical protein
LAWELINGGSGIKALISSNGFYTHKVFGNEIYPHYVSSLSSRITALWKNVGDSRRKFEQVSWSLLSSFLSAEGLLFFFNELFRPISFIPLSSVCSSFFFLFLGLHSSFTQVLTLACSQEIVVLLERG